MEALLYVLKKTFNRETAAMPRFHCHNHYEIYYLFSGRVRHLIDCDLFDVKGGDVVLIKKNKLHMTKKPETVFGENIKIYLNDEAIDSLGENSERFKACFDYIHISVPESKKKLMESLFLKIRSESEKNDLFSKQLVKNLVYELMANIYKHIFEENDDSSITSINTDNAEINIAIRYIYNNYSEKLTLTEIAEMVNMNPSYFSRCFKRVTGISLMDYVNNIRIKNATTLILGTNMSMTEVAQACGYNNQSYFCRQFQKIMGCSPVKYRNDKK